MTTNANQKKDEIVSVPYKSWAQLRDLYASEWPKNILPYHLLQNYIDWHEKDSEFVEKNIEVACLNSDWKDGTFYLVDNHQLFFYTLEKSGHRLEILLKLFMKTQSREYLGCCVYDRHMSIIERAIEPDWTKLFDTPTHLYYLPRETAVTFDMRLV